MLGLNSIPEMYGLDGGGTTGWAFHLLHGIVLGVIFGYLVTRKFVLGVLTANIYTPVLGFEPEYADYRC